jgi:hypothetical protein
MTSFHTLVGRNGWLWCVVGKFECSHTPAVQIQHFEIFTHLWAEMNGCGGSNGKFEFLGGIRIPGARGGSGNVNFLAGGAQ